MKACCKKPQMTWESIAGVILVFREVKGRKVYKWRCSGCGMTGETTDGPSAAAFVDRTAR